MNIRRIYIVVVLVCIFTASCRTPLFPERLIPGLVRISFNSLEANGIPNAVQIDQQVDFDWQYNESPSQGIGRDFSIKWLGILVPPETKYYTFQVWADNCLQLSLDGFLLVDDCDNPTNQWHYTSPIMLEKGERYEIKFDMHDFGGYGGAQLNWSYGNIDYELIPAKYLYHLQSQVPNSAPLGAKDEHEICVPNLSDPDVQDMMGTPVPPEFVFKADRENLLATQVNSNDFSGSWSDYSYNIVIIPVGYTTEQIGVVASHSTSLQFVVDQLGLNVNYSFLNKSMPMEVYKNGGRLKLNDDEIEIVNSMIVSVYGRPELLMFDINAAGRGRHSWVDDIEYLISQQHGYLYTGIHEFGHSVGLGDGYEDTFYSYGGIKSNTEFFHEDSDNKPVVYNDEWRQWITDHNPEFVQTDMVCLKEPLLKMKGASDSVMAKWWDDDDIIEEDSVNSKIFTDFQVWVMKQFIEKRISEKSTLKK